MASSLAASAARRALNLTRLSNPISNSHSLIQRRPLSAAADHGGPQKVNIWEDPMSPSKWKDEHMVILSLTGWGLLFYGSYKFFTKGKKEDDKTVAAA